MNQSDLDTDQCKRLRDAAGQRLGWVRRLQRRMDERGWAKSDPLYEQVRRASAEFERLDMLLLQIGVMARKRRVTFEIGPKSHIAQSVRQTRTMTYEKSEI